jgi:chromate transporter
MEEARGNPESASTHAPDAIRELARLFLRLGIVAFGGPAAHIAMMEDEVVRRRGWLSHDDFLDMLGATNLIPGPNSTEMAIHIGYRRAGWKGLLVAGTCFIVPAVLITLAIAWAYVKFGAMPQAEALLYGIKPVIIAVVVQALWRLGRAALRDSTLVVLGVMSVVASFVGLHELVVLFGAGVIMAAHRWMRERFANGASAAASVMVSKFAVVKAVAAGVAPFSLMALFLFFLKVGAVLFGSGYVLLAFIQADLVDRLHWLTKAQLLDAVAVGQITPGPVFSTATFVGYLLGGVPGATVSTIGIFLASFVFVALSGVALPYLRRSPITAAFLDGVNVGALALMVLVTWQLGLAAMFDFTTIALAVVSAVLLLRFQLNSAWVIVMGGIVGILALG